ncbi:Uncharacterized protein HZ326_11428 [Fusarium oxysporum f. sp. albedinis]|nr:Uncharacterized protein HZ326_11428 [Fusarium oxysporum f. sp. albedinis]
MFHSAIFVKDFRLLTPALAVSGFLFRYFMSSVDLNNRRRGYSWPLAAEAPLNHLPRYQPPSSTHSRLINGTTLHINLMPGPSLSR